MDKKLLLKVQREIISKKPKPRAHLNMTLGALRKALTRERVGTQVVTSDGDYVGIPHSYAGHPADLAFAPSTNFPIIVSELIGVIDDVMRRTFRGATGEFSMVVNTPLWVSHIGDPNGKAIIDVIADEGLIKLILKD